MRLSLCTRFSESIVTLCKIRTNKAAANRFRRVGGNFFKHKFQKHVKNFSNVNGKGLLDKGVSRANTKLIRKLTPFSS